MRGRRQVGRGWRHAGVTGGLGVIVLTMLVGLAAPGHASASSAPAPQFTSPRPGASAGAPAAPPPPPPPPPVSSVTPPVITNLGIGTRMPRGITAGPDGNLWVVTNSGLPLINRVTPNGTFTPFSTGTMIPERIATGSDGKLWFTTTAGSIGRMGVDGVYTDFGLNVGASDLVAGADGAMWFTMASTPRIGRITTAGAFTSFVVPGGITPGAITAGPDGNLWFTSSGNSISRMTTAGDVTTFVMPGTGFPGSIAAGSDGNLWFTNYSQRAIGKLTTAGVPTMYTSPQVGHPQRITRGSDGNMWFSNDYGFYTLGTITPAGVITANIRVGDGSTWLPGMALGPDGNVWFTTERNSIGRVTPARVVTLFKRDWVDSPGSITPGPDGALWFVNRGNASIGRVTTDGSFSHFVDAGITSPNSITAGPDGNLWFVNAYTSIGRMTPGGAVTTFKGTGVSPTEIVAGSDGNLWFTIASPNNYWNGIGRITPAGEITTFFSQDVLAPRGIIAGPDGNLWFHGGSTQGAVYRITPAGVVTTFAVPVAAGHTLAVGPDGNIWFTNGNDSIGYMTTEGAVTTMAAPGVFEPYAIAAGPDGNLWVTSASAHALARVTTSGVVTVLQDESVRAANRIAAGPDGAMWFTNEGNNSIGKAATTPGVPSGVSAVPGRLQATVTWTAPLAGSGPITASTVTASPGGATCTWSVGPTSCVVGGLSAGVAYTFTVTATNVNGTGAASAPSLAVVPWDGSGYHPVPPVRILDSRTSVGSWPGPLTAGVARSLQVTGLGGGSDVPATATAVVMNVTATASTANSFLRVWPTGSPPPTSSNLNFAAGETIPNLVTTKLGSGGAVSFATAQGSVQVVADVVGYYDDGTGPGDLFTALSPTRLLDSRTSTGGWSQPLAAGAPRDLVVRQPGNSAGVAPTATAVVANVTVTGGTAGSFVAAWPTGLAQPVVSNLNFGPGQTIANLAVLPIGADGSIRFANAVGAVDVIVDVVGYFDPAGGARFHATEPTRVLDDRSGTGLVGPWGPAQERSLAVAGANGSPVPAAATAVVANLTATGATAGSFVTAFPGGTTRPNASNVNFGPGQTIPNLITVGLGAAGDVVLFNQTGSVDLVADVVGYYAST